METPQTSILAKLPMLKQNEYDLWRLRIEQYFMVQDYALWDIIINGDSFKPIPIEETRADGSKTTKLNTEPVTNEERIKKKNDQKARNLLLMAIPNDQVLNFSHYETAKTLFEAVVERFGGNEATKKAQKTLLKQSYENFTASSNETLDHIFNRLQKIISQLTVLKIVIPQEDLNMKFLNSLPSEWNTYVVVWSNKPELEKMTMNEL